MIEKASDPELVTAFETHLAETHGHVTKVETLLRCQIGDSKTETCKVINGLTSEASDTIKDVTGLSIWRHRVDRRRSASRASRIRPLRNTAPLSSDLSLADDAVVLLSIKAEEVNADELLSDIAARVDYQAAAQYRKGGPRSDVGRLFVEGRRMAE